MNQLNKQNFEFLLAKSNWLQFFLISLFALLVWYPVLFYDFLSYDDLNYFYYPEIVAFSWELLPEFFTKQQVGNYIPLTTLSFTLEYSLFGQNPIAFHITNLVLHILNAFIALKIIQRIFLLNITYSLLLIFIFISHPLQVESVSWISCRGLLLSSFFALLSIHFYLRNRETTNNTYYVLSLIAFILSIFSKPTSVVIPIFLVMLDWFYDKKGFKNLVSVPYLLKILPFFICSLLVGIITVKFTESALVDIGNYSNLDKLFVFGQSLVFYIYKFIFPIGLGPFHFYPQIEGGGIPWYFYLSIPFLITISISIFKLKQPIRKQVILGSTFFLVNIFLMIQIIPARPLIAAERYSYLPLIGILMVVAALISFYHSKQYKPIILGILMVFILGFGYKTLSYQKVWANTDILMLSSLNKYKDHTMRYLPLTLLGTEAFRKGEYNTAVYYFELAQELMSVNLSYFDIQYGRALIAVGDIKEGLQHFEAASKKYPQNDYILANLAGALTTNGKHQEAIEKSDLAISINPLNYIALTNKGIALARLGSADEAIISFNRSEDLNPNQEILYYYRGFSHLLLSQKNQACIDWQIALELGYAPAETAIEANCK